MTADNKEQDDGGSLLGYNGKTNSGDRSDYDDDEETASRATGESIKCEEVSLLVISSISFV